MLLLAICLFFISKAHKELLVAEVVNTFGECTGIIRAVGDFIDVVDTVDFRRRAERQGLAKEVDEKLDSCSVILNAVNNFRLKYIPNNFGRTTLAPAEMAEVMRLLETRSKKMGKVLYIASRDGQTSADFIRECSNQGPTVVIVETTKGALFGGYTDGDWKSSNTFVPSSSAFLFRLRPSFKMYPVKGGRESYATQSHSSWGPTFGGGNAHDLHITSTPLTAAGSYTKGGYNYEMAKNSYELSNGESNFQVKDYFVAQAI